MKVTNWWKKLSAAIVAAGIFVPSVGYAITIPVGDASFETYPVPAVNYAYAKDPAGAYRPTSPWVSNMDSPDPAPPGPTGGQYTEDVHVSNYLYNTAYANPNNRPTPRTLDQAMHGFAQYSSQDLPGVTFEAGKTYTLSVWAQNDTSNNFSKGVFLYLYNANLPFSDANAIEGAGAPAQTAINTRTAGMTSAQSQANWSLLSISHTVAIGAPEVGAPLGIGFFVRRGTAIDDVSLDVVPEPTTVILVGMGGMTLLGLRRRR
jgi:hypothetical protein